MNDYSEKLINASDLIEWIMEAYPDWCEGAVRGIVGHIDALPTAEPEWIPVKERDPENGKYITTYRDKRTGKIGVTVDYFCEFGWFDDGEYFETLAWMPLPEPYAERRTNATD